MSNIKSGQFAIVDGHLAMAWDDGYGIAWCYTDGDGDSCSVHVSEPTTTVPVAVISPEDREQIERLGRSIRDAAFRSGDSYPGMGRFADGMQAALREFANPQPVKPEEPQGLGAVAEDTVGRIWVAADTTTPGLRWHGEDGWRSWDELNVVKVLSEGVVV